MNNFYVYAYLRHDETPYYIGKGKNTRAFDTDHCIYVPKSDKIKFIYSNLTENTAFALEIFWIKVFGRKDLGTGILRNQTDGGDGASNPSLSTREKLSNALKGRKSPMLGRTHKSSSKDKIRQSVRKSYIGRAPINKGKINSNGKQIMTPYGIFNSGKHASRELNVAYHTVIRLCDKDNSGWFRIGDNNVRD